MGPTAPQPPPDSALDDWKANAATWKANEAAIRTMTAEVTARLLATLDPLPGHRILDVAAGIGNPSLDIAARVGPTGRVVATDGVAEMLADLRRRADEVGLAQIQTAPMAAEDLTFDDDTFDGACSRFGVMFFADAVAALGHMARCVRTGGRLVVTCWGDSAHNIYFTLVNTALDEAGAPELPPQSNYEFEERGHLADIARESGWRDVHQEILSFLMTIPETTPAGLLDAQVRLSRKTRQRVEQTPVEIVNRARALVAERAVAYARGPDMALPAEAFLVRGRAP
jgi:SAM-dependent methyltransferase